MCLIQGLLPGCCKTWIFLLLLTSELLVTMLLHRRPRRHTTSCSSTSRPPEGTCFWRPCATPTPWARCAWWQLSTRPPAAWPRTAMLDAAGSPVASCCGRWLQMSATGCCYFFVHLLGIVRDISTLHVWLFLWTAMADGNMHVWISMSTCMTAFMDSTNGYMCTNGCFDWLLIYVLLYMLFSVKKLSSMRICTYISNSL